MILIESGEDEDEEIEPEHSPARGAAPKPARGGTARKSAAKGKAKKPAKAKKAKKAKRAAPKKKAKPKAKARAKKGRRR